ASYTLSLHDALPIFFNTSGPNNPAKHYTISILSRLPGVRRLIEQEQYFVLHAPRQVGKTTALLSLAQELTAAGGHTAVLLTMERSEEHTSELQSREK